MDGNTQQNLTFFQFIISYVSLSVIAGLFTFRLLNSLMDNIILPLLDLTILPDAKFHKLTRVYNHKKENVDNNVNKNEYVYIVKPGLFIKELVLWCFMMIILYTIYKITRKSN
jgi:large-conductance mechanosensitive channel